MPLLSELAVHDGEEVQRQSAPTVNDPFRLLVDPFAVPDGAQGDAVCVPSFGRGVGPEIK